MSVNCDLPASVIQEIRRNPINAVLLQLGRSAGEHHALATEEFKRLVAYLLEIADGRDRREPCTQRTGVARPIPKLRVLIEGCFGRYADLEWFKLGKACGGTGVQLLGRFRFVAAGLARVKCDDFAEIVKALCSEHPDASLLRILEPSGGRVRGVGLELFARLCSVFRRDLYFLIPRPWGESSGCLKYIDGDLRRYIAVCRSLRGVCEDVGIEGDIRGWVFERAISQPQPHARLVAALSAAISPALARFAVLEPAEAYVATSLRDDMAARPLEFAADAIRGRRGERRLRAKLIRAYANRCAMSGTAPIDLLEVAYVEPFPLGHLHAPQNALLLRSDLHTLWDLNLIAVDPDTMKVRISPRLQGSAYENLADRALLPRSDGSRVSIDSLRKRWNAFMAGKTAKKPRPAAESTTSVAPAPTPPARSNGDQLSSSGSFAGIRLS